MCGIAGRILSSPGRVGNDLVESLQSVGHDLLHVELLRAPGLPSNRVAPVEPGVLEGRVLHDRGRVALDGIAEDGGVRAEHIWTCPMDTVTGCGVLVPAPFTLNLLNPNRYEKTTPHIPADFQQSFFPVARLRL